MERTQLMDLLRASGCVEERERFVFLRDPKWSEAERVAARALMGRTSEADDGADGWLCVRTGGSSGGMKFARHDEKTLAAAVAGFSAHFQLPQINAVGVLPPWHVSGLMARVRCAATGGRYLECEWRALETGQFPPVTGTGDWVISLVPTQLQRLVASEVAITWLRRFRVILVGGGPVWATLAEAAAAAKLRLSLSYGLTETAAMATAQRPEDFLAGDRSAGAPLPHARVTIDAAGQIVVGGSSLFRGYFPERRGEPTFTTQDLGRIDEAGRLHVLGRADAVIITGGKKVQPFEVEAALRASGELDEVAVVGVADAEWGEVVVACYPAVARKPDPGRATVALAAYQRPKHFVPVMDWPRRAQGKVNRVALAELAAAILAQGTRPDR